MAAYDTLRAAIDNYIKANGNKEITGTVLNDILNAMVSALGADTRFAGVAVPTTNPGNPEGNVVYFASQAGTYSNFGGIVLPLGIHILVWNGTVWTSQTWFSVDNTPTQNSQNLATSGGILQAIVDAVGVERLRAIGAEVTSCSFDGTTKKISFFNSADDTLFQLDATAFVIDGMVSDVKIEDGNLVIQFNTDAGKQDIEIPLTDIFNPANYYTKTAIDALLALYYTKTAIDALLALYYTKTETDALLALYYTKTETDALLTAINNKLADGCLYRGMAEPTTNPPTPSTKVFYIATKAGTYTNFGNIAVTEGITILKYDGSNWSKEQISYSDGVFDISAYNGTSYADLSAALGTNGANIPENLRKGGMSVKFVQSSDNNYVQYRYIGTSTATADFTNTDNWQCVDDYINNLYDLLQIPEVPITIDSYTINGYIDAATGEIASSQYGRTTDFIPLRGVKNISGVFKGTDAMACVAFYNENKELIPSLNQVGTAHWSNYNINIGGTAYQSAKYYRLCFYDYAMLWEQYFSLTITAEDALEPIQETIGISATELSPSIVSEIGYVDDIADGVISGSSHGRHTQMMSIHGVKTIIGTLKGSGTVACIAFYDKDRNYLHNLSELGTGYWKNYSLDITKPKYYQAAFFIISIYDGSDNFSNLQLSGTYGDRFDKDEQEITDLSNRVENAESEISAISAEFVEDKTYQLSENGYVGLDGSIGASDYGRHTDYIPVIGYDYLMINTKTSSISAAVAFYDKDKQCVSALSIPGTNYQTQFRIDLSDERYNDIAFVRVGAYNMASQFSTYFAQSISISSINTRLNSDPIVGMSAVIFGDSITDCATVILNENNQTMRYSMSSPSNAYVNEGGETIEYDMWPRILQKITKIGDVRNYARSGASWRTQERESGEERRNVQYQITVALNDLTNPNSIFPTVGTLVPDVVLFALGTNDATITDTYESAMAKTVYQSDNISVDVDATIAVLDDTKVCESIRKALMRIRKVLVTSQIYCILPIMRANSDFKSGVPAQVREALIKFAQEYGVIIIDGTFESGIIRDGNIESNLGTTLKDGLHPNEVGQNLMARLIISRVRSTFMKFDSLFFNP